MKNHILFALCAFGFGLSSAPVLADPVSMIFGGDVYAAGQSVSIASPVTRDAFAAGYNVSLGAPVAGNAHMGGYDVRSDGAVAGDIYAMGFSVSIAGTANGDVTAAGNTVSLRTTAPVPGNVRLAGASVVLDSEVDGSALVSGAVVTLNSTVKGDLSFYGDVLNFGPNAKVEGMVLIQAPKPVDVPESVAAASRVQFTEVQTADYSSRVSDTAGMVAKGFWLAAWLTTLWWLLLLAVGVAFIVLASRLVDGLQAISATRPWRRLGLGVIAFSALIGFVPLFALTLFGILLLPFVGLFVAVASSLAYIAGAYFIGFAIVSRFTTIRHLAIKCLIVAASLLVTAVLSSIPLLGWFVLLAVTTFGLGVFATAIVSSWGRKDAALPVVQGA